MLNPEQVLRELLEWSDVRSLPPSSALESLGRLVDVSHELDSNDGVQHALVLLKQMCEGELSAEQRVTFNYVIANAYSSLRWRSRADGPSQWAWEHDTVGLEILHLRKALQLARLGHASTALHCHILTNLASSMSFVGRVIEAVELWGLALQFAPGFAMAAGNLGQGLMAYAGCLYDAGHVALLLERARNCLAQSLLGDIHLGFGPEFERMLHDVDRVLAGEPKTNVLTKVFPLGESRDEVAYRQWCLDNVLFLNPLNDLGSYSVAARDILTTPPLLTRSGEEPVSQRLFNQLKQSFVSARFMAYLGIKGVHPHFSDREVALYDLPGDDVYGWHTEMLTASFRSSYSLFDKLALFIWHYFGLPGRPKEVSFRRVWFDRLDAKRHELSGTFAGRRNWPLRGLYWLSKDLHGDDDFRESIEPEARHLAETRHAIEHRYLAIRKGVRSRISEEPNQGPRPGLLQNIRRPEFEASTLRILKLARAALIYLSMAIHCEDREKCKTINESDVSVIHANLVRDDRKI